MMIQAMSKILAKKPKKIKESSKNEKKFIIDKISVYSYKKSFRNNFKGILSFLDTKLN